MKKAYADTILNTAKEAAARVMISEKKARGYQQELAAVRDEALRTCLRLKHMYDSKVIYKCRFVSVDSSSNLRNFSSSKLFHELFVLTLI